MINWAEGPEKFAPTILIIRHYDKLVSWGVLGNHHYDKHGEKQFWETTIMINMVRNSVILNKRAKRRNTEQIVFPCWGWGGAVANGRRSPIPASLPRSTSRGISSIISSCEDPNCKGSHFKLCSEASCWAASRANVFKKNIGKSLHQRAQAQIGPFSLLQDPHQGHGFVSSSTFCSGCFSPLI